jgi:hypothetical protein
MFGNFLYLGNRYAIRTISRDWSLTCILSPFDIVDEYSSAYDAASFYPLCEESLVSFLQDLSGGPFSLSMPFLPFLRPIISACFNPL